MPNRQLQYDSVYNFYIVQQYPSVYMQSFIVFAVCKHICMCVAHLWSGGDCVVIVLLVRVSHKFQVLLKYIP